MKLLKLLACSFFLIVGTTACSTSPTLPQTKPNSIRIRETLESTTQTPVKIDLTYCTTKEGVNLTMDVYPSKTGVSPYPAIVYIHGGGWTSGDKSDGVGLIFKEKLVNSGFEFISINYRLAPKYTFPDPIEDVKCAIRHLRANAASYEIDPQRIGVMGGSAGGQLAALLGTSDIKEGWDVGQYLDQSSRVRAIVDMYGISDLKAQLSKSDRLDLMLKIFNASSLEDPILVTYSPITYVTPDDPPFLLLHGDQDTSVWPEQSQILYNRLVAAGVPTELVMVKNAGHSFTPVEGEIQPDMPQLAQIVRVFFDKYLK
jgi:acetyl esterase/lipase